MGKFLCVLALSLPLQAFAAEDASGQSVAPLMFGLLLVFTVVALTGLVAWLDAKRSLLVADVKKAELENERFELENEQLRLKVEALRTTMTE